MPQMTVTGQSGFGGITLGYPWVDDFQRRFDSITNQTQAGLQSVTSQFPGQGSRDYGNFGPPGGPGAPGGGGGGGGLSPPPGGPVGLAPQPQTQNLSPPPGGGGPGGGGPGGGGRGGMTPRRTTNGPGAGQSSLNRGTNFGNRF